MSQGAQIFTCNKKLMGIIEKKKFFVAILEALIIFIRKRLNRSKISSLVENDILTRAIRFLLLFASGVY